MDFALTDIINVWSSFNGGNVFVRIYDLIWIMTKISLWQRRSDKITYDNPIAFFLKRMIIHHNIYQPFLMSPRTAGAQAFLINMYS